MLEQDLEHFRNLVSLAAIDGKIEEIERITLSKIAYERGISVERMNIMLNYAGQYVYLIPQNTKERDKQLHDMLNFALVDGEFADAEKKLIFAVGKKLGFSEKELNTVIEETESKTTAG